MGGMLMNTRYGAPERKAEKFLFYEYMT